MNLISIGDRVRAGSYTVHSRFKRAVNFLDASCMVFVVDASIGSGPLNIVVNDADLEKIQALEVRKDAIVLNSVVLRYNDTLRYDSAMRFAKADLQKICSNIDYLEKIMLEKSHPKGLMFLRDANRLCHFQSAFERAFVQRMQEGVIEFFSGDMGAGVRKIKGCGFGLTPSGDDFIAGLLIGLNIIKGNEIGNYSRSFPRKRESRRYFNIKHASRAPGSRIKCGMTNEQVIEEIYRAAIGKNIFSNTFLRLAKEGFLMEKIKAVLSALVEGSRAKILHSTSALFSIGESSGADLATGLLMVLQRGFIL